VTRRTAREYRRLAQECRAMARSVSTEEARAALLEMAQVWLRLAEQQEAAIPPGEAATPPAGLRPRSRQCISNNRSSRRATTRRSRLPRSASIGAAVALTPGRKLRARAGGTGRRIAAGRRVPLGNFMDGEPRSRKDRI
jgi:hypothetical protein